MPRQIEGADSREPAVVHLNLVGLRERDRRCQQQDDDRHHPSIASHAGKCFRDAAPDHFPGFANRASSIAALGFTSTTVSVSSAAHVLRLIENGIFTLPTGR